MPAALPSAVARKAEAATRLLAEATAARAAAPAPQPSPTPSPTPSPSPAGAVTDLATLQRMLADTQENLRQSNARYDTLRSKYDAELPRAAQDLRESREEQRKLSARVGELEQLLAAGAGSNTLTEEERRLAGPDLLKVMEKVSNEAATKAAVAAVKPLAERQEDLQRMTDAAYFQALDEGLPEWERQNDDPRFMAWLQQVDPVTQRVRMDALKRAEAGRQGYRVLEIFKAFKEGREIGAPQAGARAGLETRVEPAAGGGSGDQKNQVDAAGKRIWTRGEIKQFYAEKNRGDWRGREQEARTIEEDIFAANSDGRVRG